jgi:DNA-binding response OmpR family regulator
MSIRPESAKTVLVVEDDQDARFIYATTLRHAGYEVVEAPCLAEAAEAVRLAVPDAVLLDCRLPDGDGLGLLRQWSTTEMARVPVIVLTAHLERQDVEAALVAGADAFVPKPCAGDVLLTHLERALHSNASARHMRRTGR